MDKSTQQALLWGGAGVLLLYLLSKKSTAATGSCAYESAGATGCARSITSACSAAGPGIASCCSTAQQIACEVGLPVCCLSL